MAGASVCLDSDAEELAVVELGGSEPMRPGEGRDFVRRPVDLGDETPRCLEIAIGLDPIDFAGGGDSLNPDVNGGGALQALALQLLMDRCDQEGLDV
jgi:hypothetical protein